MLDYSLRRLLSLVAIYVGIWLVWAAFAHWIPSTVIEATYHGQNVLIPNLVAGEGVLPTRYYLDRWSMVVDAVPLAVGLHLVIVLLIYSIDGKNPVVLQSSQTTSLANIVLIVFSGAFLGLTVLSGDRWDYTVYLAQWIDVLEGRNPWNFVHSPNPNAYGPLFNLMAPSVWFNLLANKLFFAFAYLVYVIWLIKDFGPRRGLVTFSFPWVLLLLVNPFPWWQIAYLGYFDILVGIACVIAVHWRVRGKDWLSGASLAAGILLKFMPIVILPFLAFNGRWIRFRLIFSCIGVLALGMAVSVLVWGTSTFSPLTYAATRGAVLSIYNLLDSTHSPLRLFWDSPDSEWVSKPLLAVAGLCLYVWCVFERIGPALSAALAVLVTLLFYWVGWSNYQMVFFVLVSYWAVSDWERLSQQPALIALLVGYFVFLAVADIARSFEIKEYLFYSNMGILLLRFVGGCTLLAVLLVFGSRNRIVADDKKSPAERVGTSWVEIRKE